MGWLQDNMGYVAFFAIILLVLILVLGIVTGRFPDITEAVRNVLGA